jgi:hypothetical protein
MTLGRSSTSRLAAQQPDRKREQHGGHHEIEDAHLIAGSFAHGHGVRRAISLSLGVVLGAQLGARLSLRASGRVVESLLGIALLALAARLIFSAV